jgi:hypothetical protein
MRPLGVALLVLPLSCVLLVDPPSGLGTTCEFAGEATTACGKCLAQACRAQIDACCADSACKNTLGALDACASRSDCASLYASGNALGACAQGCAEACGPAAADASTVEASTPSGATCAVAADKESCTCTAVAADAGVPPKCDAKALGGTSARCCVKKTWPATGATCRCDRVRCSSRTDACSCEINPQIDDTSTGCDKASYDWTCCLSDARDYCYCAQGFSCQSGSSYAPGACAPSDLGCASDERAVASCDVE